MLYIYIQGAKIICSLYSCDKGVWNVQMCKNKVELQKRFKTLLLSICNWLCIRLLACKIIDKCFWMLNNALYSISFFFLSSH